MWRGTGLDPGELQPLTETFSERELFASAQPMSIRLRGVMLREDYDMSLRGRNDLAVITKFQIGDEPPVERLQVMEREAGVGWHDDFFDGVVFSTRDFTGERLTLRIQVYDIDGLNEEIVTAAERLAKQAAGLFPPLAPYVGVLNAAVDPLVDLVNHIDDHDRVLDDRVTLEVADPELAINPLQPGLFVKSKTPLGEGCKLRDDCHVVDSSGEEYREGSYAVLEIRREQLADRQFEVSQKAAKLVSELEGKGQSGKPAISFLEETLKAYSNFERLERAAELQSQETLTEAQRKLLADLQADEALEPFLTE